MSGGFGMGFLKGALISLMGLSALSMVSPLKPLDPGKSSQVDLTTPKGSGFNAERADSNPVLPSTDQTVEKENVPLGQTGSNTPDDPSTDTSTASQPTAQDGIELPDVDAGSDDVAMVSPGADASPTNTPPALGVPMPRIDNPVREIPVNQLPIIEPPTTEVTEPPAINQDGDQVDDNATGETATASDVSSSASETTKAGALQRNKVVFQNPSDKPLMSIILVDAGDKGLDKDVLLTFSFPVTFALDASAVDATADAKDFARKGFEVLAMAPTGDVKLEQAENDADVAAVLNGIFAGLPQAVGLIDAVSADIQQSPELAKQVIAGLRSSGHGLLTYDIGLNSTDKKAGDAGVYSGTVFRVLDGEGEKAATIKRYLNRAVLEAGKDGHVIVLGRTYPETVTALFSWALSSKSSTVALAPVSASLLAK
jgi:uncharacterized protein